MMRPAIHEVVRRLKRIPLHHQIQHLQAVVKAEKPRSVRRGELEALLRDRMLRQLRKEIRA